jgi:hypothetical protein
MITVSTSLSLCCTFLKSSSTTKAITFLWHVQNRMDEKHQK